MLTASTLVALVVVPSILKKLFYDRTRESSPPLIENIRAQYFAALCLLGALLYSVDLWIAFAPTVGRIMQAVLFTLIVAVIVATNIHVELARSKGGQ